MPALFDALEDAALAGDEALLSFVGVARDAVLLELSVFMRAINAIKAVRLLLAEAHWEFAAGPIRQTFELLLNMEHLVAQPVFDEAMLEYATFGLSQEIRARRATADYDQATGRPVDPATVERLDATLESAFPQFRTVKASGKVVWANSWTGKTTRELAEGSPSPMRAAQYRHLFTTWSEQMHGAPVVHLAPLMSKGIPTEVMRDDDVRVSEYAGMALALFVELWRVLPDVPPIDPVRAARWTDAVLRQAAALGAPVPASLLDTGRAVGAEHSP